MIHQLRIYEIFEHDQAAFHERFREHATHSIRTHGFHILLVGEIEDRLLVSIDYASQHLEVL